MDASATQLLILYSACIVLVSWLGGLLPGWVRMTHTRTHLILSLVAGLMLGVALLHLLPHAVVMFEGPHAVDAAAVWLLTGLVTLLLLLRVFPFRLQGIEDDDHHREHHHDHQHPSPVNQLSWLALAAGLGIHALLDGVALGAAMQAQADHGGRLMAFGVFLAILLHKPLGAMAITSVMAAGGWSRSAQLGANGMFALLCPLGAVLFYAGVDALIGGGSAVVAAALAFSAGAFVCIALSDLIPEIHFHSHDRVKLTLAFLLGIAIAYSIGALEPAGAHHG